MPHRERNPAATRSAILDAAHAEFHRYGFQGGSLNRIVERADLTKGALFHHFRDKAALASALVVERYAPWIELRWLEPLRSAGDPLAMLRSLLHAHLSAMESGNGSASLELGCPILNLANEMSPLDETLREQLLRLHAGWRDGIADALAYGRREGQVHGSIDPAAEAVFLLGTLIGATVQAKTARDPHVLRLTVKAMDGYLETLRAPSA